MDEWKKDNAPADVNVEEALINIYVKNYLF